ncbi:MAG: hypothetical protein F2754_16470 [Actinobacteria bacterium]|uniref:Unannotated protein n=1 Tax=freshwater metagenome TaxID=449393 RepID=A0A6J6VX80_9ZZZZ|nr:hypothetical protein [Actinomycetota bacterium]MSX88979.1 hypothetical protein [Actinomycetota bacterium]MSY73649.1 hypothetical protein [Actinomycetota bacterium]
MKTARHQLNGTSYQFVVAARHRAISAWCGATTFSAMPSTKHERLKEPSPG